MSEQYRDVRFADSASDAVGCLAGLLDAGVAREVIRISSGGEVTDSGRIATQNISWQGQSFVVAVFSVVAK